ncbi:MAG TPA: hypothetical protein VL997_13335, partial [Dyella sp.]|nr:hypothetical protein [Dyella sp.]
RTPARAGQRRARRLIGAHLNIEAAAATGTAAFLFPARNFLLHGSENPVMIPIQPPGPFMSSAVYTATVLTSARMAAGMTSRARRPLDRHLAG